MNQPVGVWLVAEPEDLVEITSAAMDRTVPPDFGVVVLSSTGDTVGLQVTTGQPKIATGHLVYVERRGSFEVSRIEIWPPVRAGDDPRLLLKLRAWPMKATLAWGHSRPRAAIVLRARPQRHNISRPN